MKKSILIIALAFNCVVGLSQNHYISRKINVAGEEGWDYLSVDNINQHLFISHGTVVNVVDLKTDKTIATIAESAVRAGAGNLD